MNIMRITRRVLAVVLVVAAVSTPAAAASTFEERFPSLADRPGLSTAEPTESPTVQPQAGFDWGDATIGAAAMLAITAIAAGGVVELSRRRKPRPTVA